jgi:hypothetical protein
LEGEILNQKNYTEDIKDRMDEELVRIENQMVDLDEKLHSGLGRESDLLK